MQSLRVMTFNIRHGRGMDDVIDLRRIARVIADAGADLVALNEVDRVTRRSGGVDQPAELATMLDMHWDYCASIPYQGGEYGNAVLSRLPIVRSQVHRLPKLGNEARTLLHAEVEWGGGPLNFLVTHLGLGEDEQRGQLEAIAGVVNELAGPKIVAGDFNFDVMQQDLFQHMPPGIRDAWRLQQNGAPVWGTGDTFPADKPEKRIDYILISAELTVHDPFRPIPTLASDHLPVVGEVRLKH